MALKIAAWNVEGRLSAYEKGRRGTPAQILAGIKQLDADIIVLPEAYLNEPSPEVDAQLKAMRYEWYDTNYLDTMHDDDVAEWGFPHMRVLSRVPILSAETRRWGNLRDLPVLIIKDPTTEKEICIIAIHLDDINEERRLQQLDEIIPFIKKSHQPVVMLGDFNAMWHEGRARLIGSRFVGKLAHMLPQGRLEWMMTRANEMAIGTVMQRLKEAGLREADLRLRPTTTPKKRNTSRLPAIRLMQIDHILYSTGIKAGSFQIGKDGGSDHRAISAILTLE